MTTPPLKRRAFSRDRSQLQTPIFRFVSTIDVWILASQSLRDILIPPLLLFTYPSILSLSWWNHFSLLFIETNQSAKYNNPCSKSVLYIEKIRKNYNSCLHPHSLSCSRQALHLLEFKKWSVSDHFYHLTSRNSEEYHTQASQVDGSIPSCALNYLLTYSMRRITGMLPFLFSHSHSNQERTVLTFNNQTKMPPALGAEQLTHLPGAC